MDSNTDKSLDQEYCILPRNSNCSLLVAHCIGPECHIDDSLVSEVCVNCLTVIHHLCSRKPGLLYGGRSVPVFNNQRSSASNERDGTQTPAGLLFQQLLK